MRSAPTLVTGGSGFLGSHLVAALRNRGVLAPRSSELDLLDQDAVERFLDGQEIGQIVHAAGFVGGLGLNRAHPGRMIVDNLRMGTNLLEGAAKRGIHTVIVSTACVYPDDAPVPTPEAALYAGYPTLDTSFYGIAKRTLHTMAEGLRREYGSTYDYLIPINVYGPGDHFDDSKSHVVAALLKRTLAAKREGLSEMTVWGSGTQTRDFLYVDDAVAGIVAALDRSCHNEVFNLGSGRETSIRELAETIRSVVGYEGRLVFDSTKPAGAARRSLDIRQARERLGFHPRVELQQGLERMLDWYLANENDAR